MSFCEFTQFCQKVIKQWLLCQPDSGLKSESSESVNAIEKSDLPIHGLVILMILADQSRDVNKERVNWGACAIAIVEF